MEVIVETCCGIDVHQKSIVCCILDGPWILAVLRNIANHLGRVHHN